MAEARIAGTKTFPIGVFTMRRAEVVSTFHCDRCDEDKTAKNRGEFVATDGATKTLCNGCYGFLMEAARRGQSE